MYVAMPTMSERAFTDICLLQQVPAPHAASWRYRSTIAFPKTQRGQDLLTGAPSAVEEKQLRELGLRLREKPKA